jgi:hypothetical protein
VDGVEPGGAQGLGAHSKQGSEQGHAARQHKVTRLPRSMR